MLLRSKYLPCHQTLPFFLKNREETIIPVTMAGGFHLFPFRTQKLSLLAPMVLPGVPVGEWVVAGMIVSFDSDKGSP